MSYLYVCTYVHICMYLYVLMYLCPYLYVLLSISVCSYVLMYLMYLCPYLYVVMHLYVLMSIYLSTSEHICGQDQVRSPLCNNNNKEQLELANFGKVNGQQKSLKTALSKLKSVFTSKDRHFSFSQPIKFFFFSK